MQNHMDQPSKCREMNRLYRFLLLVFCLGFLPISPAEAQVNGGRQAYSFLELPVSARLTALGGMLISARDRDVNLGAGNPALLSQEMHGQLSFNHAFHAGGTGHGYFGYGHHLAQQKVTIHGGVRYMQYGDIPWRDEFNQDLGTFSPRELAAHIGAGWQWQERISIGANLRFIQAQYETYKSTALASDLGLYYENPQSKIGIGVVLQNIGGQLSRFTDGGDREKLPFNSAIGVSKRLKYLPLRLSVTAHTLHRWNIRYDDPDLRTQILFPGQQAEPENSFSQGVDNAFRHLIFSGEFLFGKTESFRIRIAYDHRLRRELLVPNYGGLAGFSGGLGFRIYRFHLDYGFGVMHQAGTAHHLSISTNLKEFFPSI